MLRSQSAGFNQKKIYVFVGSKCDIVFRLKKDRTRIQFELCVPQEKKLRQKHLEIFFLLS